MKVKPKYKIGQKVILLNTRSSFNGKYDVGYIIGMEVRRSYKSAGIFQWGGLSIFECEKNGYLETYMNNIDEVVYHVLRRVRGTNDVRDYKDLLEKELVPYNKENVKKYVE